MIIQAIKANNFRNHQKLRLELNSGVTVISGPNGSGKSSIFYALIYALWGSINLKALVQAGSRDMAVQVQCLIGADTIAVTRSCTMSGKKFVSRLQLNINGQDASQATIDATQALIERYVGTEGSAYSTFLIRQGQLKEFIEAKPSKRRAVLSDLLALSPRWDVLHQAFHSKVRSSEITLTEITSKLGVRKTDLEETLSPTEIDSKLESDRKLLASYEERYKAAVKAENDLIQDEKDISLATGERNSKTGELNTVKQNILSETNKLSELKTKQGSADEIRNRAKKLQEEFDEQTKAKATLDTNDTETEAELERLNKAIEADEAELRDRKQRRQEVMNSPLYTEWQGIINDYNRTGGAETCFTCGQPIAGTHREQLLEKLRDRGRKLATTYNVRLADISDQEKLNAAKEGQQKQIKTIDGEIGTTESLLEKHRIQRVHRTNERNKRQAAFREAGAKLDHINSKLRTATAEVTELDNLDARITELQGRITKYEGRRDGLLGEIAEINKRLAGSDKVKAELQEIRENKTTYSNRVSEIKQDLVASDKALIARRTLERQIAELEADEIAARANLRRVRLTAQTLSPQGARQLLLDRKLVEIQNTANEYLSRLDDQMSVLFNTQRASGVETLEVNVSSESIRPIETYSGGEQTRLAFVLRLAFLASLSKRSKQSLLLLDEPFGDQDPGKSELMNSLILQVATNYEQVFIISHSSALINGTDQRIEL